MLGGAFVTGIVFGIMAFALRHRITFFFRLFILTAAVFLITGCLIPFSLIFWRRREKTTYYATKIFWRIRKLVGIDIEVRDAHILDLVKGKPAVILANHQSSLDLLPLSAVWQENWLAVAKREILLIPIFGVFLWVGRNIFVNRQHHGAAMKSMDSACKQIVDRKAAILLFPEGTRNREHPNTLLPFKKGAFHIAVQAQVPIIPIVFSSYQPVYSSKNWSWPGGKIVIQVLPPIPTEGMKADDVAALCERTRNIMVKSFLEINGTTNGKVNGKTNGEASASESKKSK